MTGRVGFGAGSSVLITGASSGIGAALAARLAPLGVRLLLSGRDPDRLAAVARPLGARMLVADLSVPGAGAELGRRALSAAGHVDVLINNAGVGAAGPTATTPQDPGDLLAVNLLAPIQLTQALLPALLERGRGQVVFVGSIAGSVGVREEAVYAASKAGLACFADSLRQEVGPRGVNVLLVVPGVVDTPFFARRGAPYDRGRPRPIPAPHVATVILRGLQAGRDDVVVPGWLRIPDRLHGVAPGLYRRLAQRWS